MAGDYADPTIVRVGEDYYMAFTRRTGIMLWHSRDLVNWRPIIRHTLDDLDGILATDLAYFNGKFHSYMPAGSWPGKAEERYPPNRANFVITAEKPEGPWSEPIRVDRDPIEDDLYVGNDPGFIQTPEGKKYLHTDVGFVMPLSDDGLRVTAPAELVYDGWEYPKDWIVEAKGLESPKLFFKSGFYYMVTCNGRNGWTVNGSHGGRRSVRVADRAMDGFTPQSLGSYLFRIRKVVASGSCNRPRGSRRIMVDRLSCHEWRGRRLGQTNVVDACCVDFGMDGR